MNKLLQETWTQVQRAETLLVQTAVYSNRERYRNILAAVDLERESLALFIRTSCGLNRNGFHPEDYLIRYPYSSTSAIRAGLEKVVEAGYIDKTGENLFALNGAGRQAISRCLNETGGLIQEVDLGATTHDEVQKFLDYDHRILEALAISETPHGNPILKNRLQGFHPACDPRELWHHWQLVWTMLAAHEDEVEFLRQIRRVEPMQWFVHRQLWFPHRRPWLARALTYDQLVNRAIGYSPVDEAEKAVATALDALKEKGWLREEGDELRLTKEGLAAHDEDEAEYTSNFLARWPAFSRREIEELNAIASRLNLHLAELHGGLQA